MLRRVRAWPTACLLAAALAHGYRDGAAPAAKSASTPSSVAAPAAATASEPKRTERPLPAFEGVTLTGEHVTAASFLGKRLLLFLFNPEIPDAAVVAKALAGLSRIQGSENFALVGVAA